MSTSFIGKTLWVALALPATNTASAFAALTWVQVKGVQTLPQFGISHNAIDVPDLQSGLTTGIKGAATGNDSTATFRIVASDTGQGHMKTLADAQSGVCSLRIVKGSGTDNAPASGDPVEYAQGFLHSYLPVQGDDTNHEGFSVNFRQNAATVVSTIPA